MTTLESTPKADLGNVEAEVTVALGRKEMPLGQVRTLQPFDVSGAITVRTPKMWALMGCAYAVTVSTFIVAAFAWKERMGVSYAMVYCAPVTMGAIDFMFFLWLPKAERNKKKEALHCLYWRGD